MMTDIEIAQAAKPKHILEIAKDAGVDEKYIELYGRNKAKLDLSLLTDAESKPDGKLILVTAITPTPAGEGKTTTTIGLADGMKRIGKSVAVALREPSLGPVFGLKNCLTYNKASVTLKLRNVRKILTCESAHLMR